MHREMLDYREGQDLKSLNYTANNGASEAIRGHNLASQFCELLSLGFQILGD